jgi:hypothetical protein
MGGNGMENVLISSVTSVTFVTYVYTYSHIWEISVKWCNYCNICNKNMIVRTFPQEIKEPIPLPQEIKVILTQKRREPFV